MLINKVNLLFGFLLSTIISFGATSTIKIKINQPSEYTLYASQVENFFTDEEIGYQVNLENDAAEFSLDLAYSKIIILRYTGKTIRLYVSPGDQQSLSWSAYDPMATLQFSGSNAAANRFLQKIDTEFPLTMDNRLVYQEYLPALMDETVVTAASNSESGYQAWVAERKQRRSSLLSQSGLSGTAKTFMNDLVKFEEKSEKLFYYLVNKYSFRPEDIERSRKQYGLTTDTQLNYSQGLNHPSYIKYISIYIQHLNQTKKQHQLGIEFSFYELIDEKLQGKVAAFLKTKLLYNTYRFGQNDLAQTKYGSFKKINTYPTYAALLENLFGDQLEVAEEGDAPNFTLVDTNGRQVSLSDYKGKVVYLSFWATWCKPCLAGFEKSLYIRKRLEEAGVVLINVSIDKNADTWRRTMDRIEMPGVNLHAPDDEIKRRYGLSSLPVYHIIDKQGRYAYLPEEGMRDVVEEFKKLVNK